MKRQNWLVCAGAAAVCVLLVAPLAAQRVSGYPNPFGGRWIAQLDTVEASIDDAGVSIPMFLADTMFFGEFVVRPELLPLTQVVAADLDCSWNQEDFSGRFYWDANEEPILNFIEVFRGNSAAGGDCRFEMRLVAKPDSTFIGWWCQGRWSDCRREGAASLRRQR